MALVKDAKFRKFVEDYANDKELFFKDFSAAFAKLIELGVDRDGDGNVRKRGMQTGEKVNVEGFDREVTKKPEIQSRL